MIIRPVNDYIMLEVFDSETMTKGGIIIPENAQHKTQHGIVLAIGDSLVIPVKVGETIIFDKYAGNTVVLDNDEYLLIKAKDVLGVLENKGF